MATSPPQCRTRDAAMVKATHTNHGDDSGQPRPDSTRDDRGMTASSRTTSPAAAVNRSRDTRRESCYQAKPRGRSVDKPQQPGGGRRRRKSRGHSKDRSNRNPTHHRSRQHPRDFSQDRVRPQGPDFDLPPHSPSQPHHPPPPPPPPPPSSHRGRGDPRPDRGSQRDASRSPTKRPRSPSPYHQQGGSRSKKSKRNRSPRRPGNGPSKSFHSSKHHRGSPSSSRRPRSPDRRDRHQRPRERTSHSRSLSPSSSRRIPSRSPHRTQPLPKAENQGSPPQFPKHSLPRHRSRSPIHTTRLPSRSRQPSPASRGSRPPTASDTASRRRATPDFNSHDGFQPPPRSPGDHRGPRASKRGGRNKDHSGSGKRFDPSSGANSIEVNMAARGGYRGGYNAPPMQPAFQGSHDSRAYSQSSGHATPNSSYHGSPPSQSPYGGSNRGWGGQQPYSPQQQYPQYPHGAYPAPNGNQGHFHSSPSHSITHPPQGPASQYPQGPYRGGGHRGGGPGGFRGGQFGSGGRGGHRGSNFKNSQWNSDVQPGNGRGQQRASEEPEPPIRNSQAPPPSRPGKEQDDGDTVMDDGNDNPFRPSKDLQVEDTTKPEETAEEKMPPPNRPPPTGPQSSKFSFAFKASKPAVAAPKPEISSKFNAAPPPRPEPSRDSGRDRGGLPHNVPTAPASSRPRGGGGGGGGDRRHSVDHTPRTRKVTKIMRRPKPRPTLSPELAASESIFFRKPGNESVIGSGTYGKVFKGLNVYTKNLVALKRIRMEGERDGFPVTAVREIKLLQSLKHTNIVSLQEVMVERNDCFMVFEYLSHDLTGLLNHPSFKLDAAQKKHLAKQMFEGLDYLHSRGVLHRDIKAANILVSSDGILKLADFGLARFYAKHHQLDYTNRVITIWYRSPELLLGETQYGPPVDIWSAACVMVEIFTRHAIFPGDGGEISQLDKIYAVLGTPNKTDWPNLVEMPWFELLRPGYRKPSTFEEKFKDRVPGSAFDLLAAMFSYDPAKRPTAADVLEHPYFTVEQPAPRQAVELQNLDGDWHEFESKALRRENERKEKEAKRAQAKDQSGSRDSNRDRKRPNETSESHRDPKRPHVNPKPPSQPDRVGNPGSGAGPPANVNTAPDKA